MGAHTAYPPLHTAEHLLTRLLYNRFTRLTNFGVRLKSRKAVVTFACDQPLEESDRVTLEVALQAIAAATLPVTVSFMARAEAEHALPNLHQVPAEADPVRVITVGGDDQVVDRRACIGVHVADTSQILNPRLPTLREDEPYQWRITLVVD